MPYSINLKGLSKKDIEKTLVSEGNSEIRRRALQLYGHLKVVTPVDTGRARNSWNLSYSRGQYKDVRKDATTIQTVLLAQPSSSTPLILFLSNGVPYIDRLNNGSSKQARAGFIQQAARQYFDDVVL